MRTRSNRTLILCLRARHVWCQGRAKELEAAAERAETSAATSAQTAGQLELLADLQTTVQEKNDTLAKSIAQNKELVYMLSWLEKRYDLLSNEHAKQVENEKAFKHGVTSRQAELAKLRALVAKQHDPWKKDGGGRRRDFR